MNRVTICETRHKRPLIIYSTIWYLSKKKKSSFHHKHIDQIAYCIIYSNFPLLQTKAKRMGKSFAAKLSYNSLGVELYIRFPG